MNNYTAYNNLTNSTEYTKSNNQNSDDITTKYIPLIVSVIGLITTMN